MSDHIGARVLAAMIARYPTGRWDVLRGVDAPPNMLGICRFYDRLKTGLSVIEPYGFKPASHSIPAPGLGGPVDLMTRLKFSAGDGWDIVLVRYAGEPSVDDEQL